MLRRSSWLILVALTVSSCTDETPPNVIDAGAAADAATPDAGSTIARRPNILLIIADDLGLDASSQYGVSEDRPATPTLDALAAAGIVFENAWATPACTTTRGTIISGKHGIHSGVTFVPAVLPDSTQSIQAFLRADPATAEYTNSIFGKWHLGGDAPPTSHPNRFGIDTYAGNLAGTIDDYERWPLTRDGVTSESTTYHTTEITNFGIDWIATQETPWFLWLAYVAPHSPFHLPPTSLHSRSLSGTAEDIAANPRPYYLAAIEAMDTEIGRLLGAMDPETRDNTVVIFIGDNGTPRAVIDRAVFAGSHGKNSLYEGGVRVPFLVSGAGVTERGARDEALINTTDLYATIAELAGSTMTHVYDSQSFAHRLSKTQRGDRSHNYVEFESTDVTGWATRNQRYKLLELSNGAQELYDLDVDLAEENNLLGTGDYGDIIRELEDYADQVRGISPTDVVDITNMTFMSRAANCEDQIARYRSSVRDVGSNTAYEGSMVITAEGGKCVFTSNAIPNHDFNDGARAFPNPVRAQTSRFEVTTQPTMANALTPLSLRTDNAVLLNGVKVDILAAGCFGVGDGRIGCNDINQPWRFDPMSASSGFNVDTHNAHTQPDGAYHYHGPPNALFEDSNASPSPLVGFAADGFPIFGPYFFTGTEIRSAQSSYRLRTGARPSGAGDPGGVYSGTFRDDYEYVPGLGDLDECNGMTVDGVYGYVITDAFPYVLACFKGTPDPSFDK